MKASYVKGMVCHVLAAVLISMFAFLDGQSIFAQESGRAIYYVGTTGSDKNDGLSEKTAFSTPQRAQEAAKPGDTVYFLDGTYVYTGNGEYFLITKPGAPDAYITYKAAPGAKPLFKCYAGWSIFQIRGAAYIKIEGLRFEGNNDQIKLADALAAKNVATPLYNTNGIYINKAKSHHIEIRNCVIGMVGGGGIAVEEADYVTIENNVVYSTSWFTQYATSGISVFHPFDFDSNTETYKNIIRGNICYDNETLVPWSATGRISDGNGIIVDDTKNTQIKKEPYKGRTLVEKNIVFNNGGSGINIYSSDNVDVFNNTAYNNSRSPDLAYAQIGAGSCDNVRIMNNIMYSRTGEPCNTKTGGSSTVVYDYNCYFNGPVLEWGPNDLIGFDPRFVNASDDPAAADFRLRSDSPCIEAGKSVDLGAKAFSGIKLFTKRLRDAYAIEEALSDRGIVDGLVGHWKFDEGSGYIVANSAGVDLTGSLKGAPSWVDGKSGKALKFDGIDDYIVFPEHRSVQPLGGLTVSAWIAWSVDPAALDYRKPVWMGKDDKAPYGSYGIEFDYPKNGNQWPTFHINAFARDNKVESRMPAKPGEWHLVTGVYSGSRQYIYVDGVLKRSIGIDGRLGYLPGDALGIGGTYDGKALFMGLIDDVRIYERALSPKDVAELMKATDRASPLVVVEAAPARAAPAAPAPLPMAPPNGFKVLFVGGGTPISGKDTAAFERLRSFGYEVVYYADHEPQPSPELPKFDIVFIAESVGSGNILAKYKTTEKPVIVAEAYLFDDMGFAGPTADADFGFDVATTSLNFLLAKHPIAGGLDGMQVVRTGPSRAPWCVPGGEVALIATLATSPGKAGLFAYEKGAALADGGKAAGKRAGVCFGENVLDKSNEAGISLFERVFVWAVSK